MKAIVSYIVIYISVLLFPTLAKSLNTPNYKKNYLLTQTFEFKKQQDIHANTIEFLRENEENEYNFKKDFKSPLHKIPKNSFALSTPFKIISSYTNKDNFNPQTGVPIYKMIRNFRL